MNFTGTHKFKLPSGVEAVVGELLGKHQRILTTDSNIPFIERSNEVLVDVLQSVEGVDKIDMEFVKTMLSTDRRYALIMARQFSTDFSEVFKYHFKDGDFEHTEEIDIVNGLFPMKANLLQFSKYPEIVREKELVLPRSGLKCKYRLLDGGGEAIMLNTAKKKRSSHTPLIARRCQYFNANAGKDGLWMVLPYDKMSLKDLAAIREDIKRQEGEVITHAEFDHPNTGQLIRVDLLNTIDFFFLTSSL